MLTQVESSSDRRKVDTHNIEYYAVRAMRGNKDALISLCEASAKNVLFRTSLRIDDQMDAEDVAQEILIRMCTKIRDLKNPKKFIGWLNRIIVNEINRYYSTSSNSADVISIDEYSGVATELEDDEYLPCEKVIKDEDRQAIINIVRTLPDRQQEAVILYYYDRLRVTDVAEAMDIPKQSVIRYLNLAREKIKNEINITSKQPEMAYSMSLISFSTLLAEIFGKESAGTTYTHISDMKQMIEGIVISSSVAVGASSAIGGVVATVVAASVLVIGVGVSTRIIKQNNQQPQQEIIVHDDSSIYTIEFVSETSKFSHVNPVIADVSAYIDIDEYQSIEWIILPEDGSKTLYSGTGCIVTTAFSDMQSRLEFGEYLLRYILVDTEGNIHMITKNFMIR